MGLCWYEEQGLTEVEGPAMSIRSAGLHPCREKSDQQQRVEEYVTYVPVQEVLTQLHTSLL